MSTSRYDAKRWKAIKHNYDEIANPNETEIALCLNETEVQVLLALTEYLEWPTRYYSLTNQQIDKQIVVNFAEELRCKLMCDCGSTSTANCVCNTNVLLNQLYALQLQQMDTGSYSSYAPGAPDTYYDQDTTDTTPQLLVQRADALCLAVSVYVDTVLNELKSRASSAGIITGAIGAIVAVTLPMAGLAITFIGAAIASMLEAIANDEDAVKDVKCCLLQGLRGKEISQENFALALGGCGFNFGSASAQLAAVINAHNQEVANFRSFNMLLALAMPAALTAECECEDQLVFDFTVSDWDFVIPPPAGNATGGFGAYSQDNGFTMALGENSYVFGAAYRPVRIKGVTKVRLYTSDELSSCNMTFNDDYSFSLVWNGAPDFYYEKVFTEPIDVSFVSWYEDVQGTSRTTSKLEFFTT